MILSTHLGEEIEIAQNFIEHIVQEQYKRTLYIDALTKLQDGRVYCIELKPKIFSFGDTLRQLREYSERLRSIKAVPILITTDVRFIKQFADQGIGTIVIEAKELRANMAKYHVYPNRNSYYDDIEV
jgi:hypothetical protein